MAVYRENPLYLSLEDPALYPSGTVPGGGGAAVPLYAVPQRGAAPLYSVPRRDGASRRSAPVYPTLFSSLHRGQCGGEAAEEAAEDAGEEPRSESRHRRRVRYTRTRVTMSVRHRSHGSGESGSGGGRRGGTEESDGPSPPRRLQSRWNPTLVRWSQTVRRGEGAAGRRSPSPGRRRDGDDGDAVGRGGYGSVFSRDGGAGRAGGGAGGGAGAGGGRAGDHVGEGRGRARTVISRAPHRSASLRSTSATSASVSPPRLASAGSSPDRASPFRRGSGLRRSGSLKSEREPGYHQQVDALRRRLLARTEGVTSSETSLSRRPSEVLLTARRPVSGNVFTVQDRAAEAAAAAGWAALLGRAEQAQERGWRCMVDVTDGGVKIEEIVEDGGQRSGPRSMQEMQVQRNTRQDTHTHAHTHAYSTQETEEQADGKTEVRRVHSHEVSKKATVPTETQCEADLTVECDDTTSSHPGEDAGHDDVMESPDPGVMSPGDMTSPTEGLTSGGGETRRSLVQLSSAAESGDSDRTLSVEVTYGPATRDILRLDGRVREKVDAIEAAELERELEQEFEQEYAQELQQELEQELQERLEQELDRGMAPVSGQYDDATAEDSDEVRGTTGGNIGNTDDVEEQHHVKYEYHEGEEEQVLEQVCDIQKERLKGNVEDKSRAHCNNAKKRDSSNSRQRSPSASRNSGERHRSLPTYTTHAESRQPPDSAGQGQSSCRPGRHRGRRPGQPAARPSDTPPRTPRLRRTARSDSEDEEALRRRERGWNAPQSRSRSVPRATTKDWLKATGGRSQAGRSRGRDVSAKRRSASSPPAPTESPRTVESSKTSSVCSSSVSSPSKGTSRGWRTPAGRTSRTPAPSATAAADARPGTGADGLGGGSRDRVFSPPSSLARPARQPRSTLRPALSSPSLVATSAAGHTRCAKSSASHFRMSTSHLHHLPHLQHVGQHGRQHVCGPGARTGSQYGRDHSRQHRWDRDHGGHGSGGLVRARSFSSRPAPPRGRPLTRAASARTPGAGPAVRTGRGGAARGHTLRGAHAASHANTEQSAGRTSVRRQLSPYRSSTLPRAVCDEAGRQTAATTTTTTSAAAVAVAAARTGGGRSPRGEASPRRSASLRSPRKVLSTSTETGYDSMEGSPPLRPTRVGGGVAGFGEGSLADDKWFRAVAYVPMLKTRLTATETALRYSGSPPQGMTATLREKFENLERLVSAMEEREERERREREERREASPVRDAIDHFERLRSTLSSPDLSMKSPTLVRGLSASLCRDLHRAGHQEEAADPAPRRCRPLSLSLESLRSQREASPSPHLDPARYRLYILRLLRASRASPHFRRLQRHYHSLERLMELERVTDTCSKPGTREFPSYEAWRRIRVKERALVEMKRICEQLDEAQRRREFYSRVSCRSGERWRGDRSLERRQKSVEDLKRKFDAIVDRETQESAGIWHGGKAERGARVRRSLSSLSSRQMEGLRDRLNGIYGSQTSLRSESVRSHTGSLRSRSEPRRFVDVTAGISASKAAGTASLHVRPASEPEPRDLVPTTSAASGPVRADSVHQMRTDPVTRTEAAPDAAEHRRLSLALSREVAERFVPRGRDCLVPARSKSASPAASAVSPRTCYSVDLSEEGERRTDAHEFMLVLTPEQSRPESRSASQSLPRSTSRSSLTGGERRQLVERSERLREKRLARLRRPLSVQAEEEARSSMSRSSSAQTVVERETGDVPRAVYHWEREAAAAAAEATEAAGTSAASGAGHSRHPEPSQEDQTRFNSLPCPLRPGGGRRRFLSPEYLPERSASSVELGRRGHLGENDRLQYADDFHRAFDDFARSRSVSPVGRGWSYSPPRRPASCSPPRRYGPPVRVPSVSPPRVTSPPPPRRRGFAEHGEVRRIRQLLETGRYPHRRPVPAPRLSKAASLPQLGAPPAGSVRCLTQRYEESQERQAAEAAAGPAGSGAAGSGTRGGRARSWSPPRNLRQLGAYISRTRILGKIVELQRRLRRPTTESEELEDLRSFVERERETLRRVRRGQVDRLKRQLQEREEGRGAAPRRSTSSPSLSQAPNRMQSYGQNWSQTERRRGEEAAVSGRFARDRRGVNVMTDQGSRSPIGRPGVSPSPIGRSRQFRPISGGGGRSQSEEVSFSDRPLITSTPLPCVPARPAATPSPGPQTCSHAGPGYNRLGPAHTQPTNQRSRWAGEPRDWSIHRPVGRYVPPTRSTSTTCRRPTQLGFQPYAGSRRWHCDACAVRAYNRWRTRKRNVTWKGKKYIYVPTKVHLADLTAP